MTFRNPHLPPETTAAPTADLPRLRWLTNDPAREYAQRPGEVMPLPDAVAALILCKTGKARVRRHQIVVEIEGEKVAFTREGSMTIIECNGTEQEVTWAYNRMRPDLLHILTQDGAYVESLPRKGEATWFANDAESKAAMATAKGHIGRDQARLQYLHEADTAEAVARTQANAAQLSRLVSTFPAAEVKAADAAIAAKTAPAPMPHAERMGEALEHIETQYEVRAEREKRQAARAREDERRARTVGAEVLQDLLTPPARASFYADAASVAEAEEWLADARPTALRAAPDDAEQHLSDLLT